MWGTGPKSNGASSSRSCSAFSIRRLSVSIHFMSGLLGSGIEGGRFVFTAVIGKGAYGVVYKAEDVLTGACYAVKSLATNDLTPRQTQFMRREIALHARISYLQSLKPMTCLRPTVVPLRKLVQSDPISPSTLFVVLDHYNLGDLYSLVDDKRLFMEQPHRITPVFIQLVNAVANLHKHSIYHRDLKPENILCRWDPSAPSDDLHVVLADFGLSTDNPVSNDWGCGSSFYMSPECYGQENHLPYGSAANDVWSLGVILLNLVCSRNPWRKASLDDPAFGAYAADPDLLGQMLPVSDQCLYILKRIFTIDPNKRIGLDELRSRVLSVTKWSLSEHEQSSNYVNLTPVAPLHSTEYDGKYVHDYKCSSPESTASYMALSSRFSSSSSSSSLYSPATSAFSDSSSFFGIGKVANTLPEEKHDRRQIKSWPEVEQPEAHASQPRRASISSFFKATCKAAAPLQNRKKPPRNARGRNKEGDGFPSRGTMEDTLGYYGNNAGEGFFWSKLDRNNGSSAITGSTEDEMPQTPSPVQLNIRDLPLADEKMKYRTHEDIFQQNFYLEQQ